MQTVDKSNAHSPLTISQAKFTSYIGSHIASPSPMTFLSPAPTYHLFIVGKHFATKSIYWNVRERSRTLTAGGRTADLRPPEAYFCTEKFSIEICSIHIPAVTSNELE